MFKGFVASRHFWIQILSCSIEPVILGAPLGASPSGMAYANSGVNPTVACFCQPQTKIGEFFNNRFGPFAQKFLPFSNSTSLSLGLFISLSSRILRLGTGDRNEPKKSQACPDLFVGGRHELAKKKPCWAHSCNVLHPISLVGQYSLFRLFLYGYPSLHSKTDNCFWPGFGPSFPTRIMYWEFVMRCKSSIKSGALRQF